MTTWTPEDEARLTEMILRKERARQEIRTSVMKLVRDMPNPQYANEDDITDWFIANAREVVNTLSHFAR